MQRRVFRKERARSIIGPNRLQFPVLRLILLIIISSILLAALLVYRPDATAQSEDYEEYFYSLTYTIYDIDTDGYEDSVSFEFDVDTTGYFVDISVEGYLEDSYGDYVDSDYIDMGIYDEETEYGYIYLTVTSGEPGYYNCYVDLYDDLGYWEDTWSGPFYLYPMGYGYVPVTTPTPTPVPIRTFIPFNTQVPFSTPSSGGGLSGALIGGLVSAAVLIIIGVVVSRMSGKFLRVKQAPDPRISKLRAQMEQWRERGYDVSELEDLFK